MKNYIKTIYARTNRFANRARQAKRRSRKLGAKGYFTRRTIENLYVKQSGRCACCRVLLNGKFEVDHLIPLSKGGSNYPDNLQLLTPKCNRTKGAKMEVKLNA